MITQVFLGRIIMGNTIGVKTLVVGSLGSLLSTLWLAVSPIRALRTAPAPLAEPIPGDA